MTPRPTIIIACVLFLGIAFSAKAQLVTSGADDGSEGTLRKEIFDTPAGGTVTFDNSVSTVALTMAILIDKQLTISGPAASMVTVDGGQNGRIFTVTGGPVVLNNLQLTNGLEQDGGAIYLVNASLTVNNSAITNCTANGPSGSGGGIFVDTGAVLTISNSDISGNTANRAGGGIEDQSGAGLSIYLDNVTLNGNNAGVSPAISSPGNGGGLHITGPGSASITGGTCSNNVAAAEGGGLWNGTGTMTVDFTVFQGNTASGNPADQGGGALFNAGGTLHVSNAVIAFNTADGTSGSGGGILNDKGTLSVSDCNFIGNTSVRAGGAIEENSTSGSNLMIVNSTFTGNSTGSSPGNGGGLHITGPGNSMISGGSFNNNTAALEGGGLWNGSGSMTVSGTVIDGNTASGNSANEGGGGIFNAGGSLTVSDAKITGNVADGSSGSGGGIMNDMGSLTVQATEISNNVSMRAGGGIEDNSTAGSNTTITTTLLINNSTGSSPGNGGGFHISGPGNVEFIGGLVAGNFASLEGGGIWNNTGTMTVNGTFINDNVASGDNADEGGGGIFNNGGTLVVKNAQIMNNVADGTSGSGGGILNNLGMLTVSSTEISGNTAVRAGGGIEDNSVAGNTLVMTNVDLLNNSTGANPGNGGGLHITGPGNSYIAYGWIANNEASREGGGLWNGSGNMFITGAIIYNNVASGPASHDGGGGIFNNGGNVTMGGGTQVANNMATGASGSGGGLLSIDGQLIINNSKFRFNSANRAGGAIEMIDGALEFNNSDMSGNDVNGSAGTPAPGNGGGFHITGNSSLVRFLKSTITDNKAAREGGGLWNQSGTTMNVDVSTVDNNESFGDAIDDGGAGIFNNGGTLNVRYSTVSNNTAFGTFASGGGIHNNPSGTLVVRSSTVSTNTALGDGGGIFTNGGPTNVNASTIAYNISFGSGGGIQSIGTTTLKNTLVGGNLSLSSSGTDVSGTIVSSNYNLIATDDLNVFTPQSGDIEGSDPKITPLTDNGGFTKTHQLIKGSPAIDAGSPSDMFVDQNGQPVVGGRRDIGSHESQVTKASAGQAAATPFIAAVYPNPTKGNVNLKIPFDIGEDIKIEVIELGSGRIVREMSGQSGNNGVDLNDLARGMYLVAVTSNAGRSISKVSLID